MEVSISKPPKVSCNGRPAEYRDEILSRNFALIYSHCLGDCFFVALPWQQALQPQLYLGVASDKVPQPRVEDVGVVCGHGGDDLRSGCADFCLNILGVTRSPPVVVWREWVSEVS